MRSLDHTVGHNGVWRSLALALLSAVLAFGAAFLMYGGNAASKQDLTAHAARPHVGAVSRTEYRDMKDDVRNALVKLDALEDKVAENQALLKRIDRQTK